MISRDKRFYGKSVLEGIQAPGETIYVPHFTPHSVYNTDEVVSVHDKPYFSTAIEESANLIFHTKYHRCCKFNGTDLIVRKGNLVGWKLFEFLKLSFYLLVPLF